MTMDKSIFWAGLVGAVATIPLVQMAASAKSATEINKIAQSITVMISESGGQGSGVILQKQGDVYTVLTASHVVKAKNVSYSLVAPDGKTYQIIPDSIRRPTQNIDVAVVKFRASANYATAKLGNCNLLAGGAELFVGGFPAPTGAITQSVFVFRTGTVSANSNKTFDKGYSLIYSNDTLPGMSGGVVLNSAGELVAIHGRGDREKSSDGSFSGVKTGFNLGIPINRFGTISSSLGVNLQGQVAVIPQSTAIKADDYFASAVQKDYKGDTQGALADFNRAIQINPNYAKAYFNRGYLKYFAADHLGALADYNRAIQIDPNNADFYFSRGNVKYIELNDPKGALADYNRAIQIDPNNDAYLNRGNVKRDLNDPKGALADFSHVIQIKPNDESAYINRGHLKYSEGDYRGALADYNRVVQINPKDEMAYFGRGNVKHYYLNDTKGALADYSRAVKIFPNFAEAYINRGDLKSEKLKDTKGALADLNRAIQIAPNYAPAYINRGNFKYRYLKDRSGGITDIRQAAKLYKQQGSEFGYRGAIDRLRVWGVSERDSPKGRLRDRGF
jgi:tetratricopeptide (TPR) repeat protein